MCIVESICLQRLVLILFNDTADTDLQLSLSELSLLLGISGAALMLQALQVKPIKRLCAAAPFWSSMCPCMLKHDVWPFMMHGQVLC